MERDERNARFLTVRSLPLRQLSADGEPTGRIASGCMAEFGGARWLFSVSHAVRDGQRWGVGVECDAEVRQTKILQVGAVNYAALGSLVSGSRRRFGSGNSFSNTDHCSSVTNLANRLAIPQRKPWSRKKYKDDLTGS